MMLDSPEPKRLKCPNCGLEYGVAGLAALGVEDGTERPCSFECEEQLDD